ncbi:cytochrome c oxidase subunit II [Skermania sp. ID1734]|uniref:aa3-type cytochrome oxidase subunit II n=1 Tax=Skermania sp. ID1734 TaxID=2597516 RepID=UPI00210784B8|nr:cytochrome c oxidase subunit II [Skermania sp. ID1734]
MLSGCSINNDVLRFGWPTGVTEQAHRMRELWTWSCIAALVMGVIVWGLTFWTVTFHRKKKGDDEFPKQFGYNVPLELAYTAAPFVIIAILFYFTVVVQNYVTENKPNPDVTVDVTAFQWNWKFGYRTVGTGPDKVDLANHQREDQLKQQTRESVEHKNDEGEPRPGPIQGKDVEDLGYLHYDRVETVGTSTEIPILVVPTGKRVQIELASADVVHSFWVPEFLFKRDVMPDPEANHQENIFQISNIDREGAFVGRCAEMCGTYHSMMNFEVRALNPQRFARYIELRKPTDMGGKGLDNASALTQLGKEDPSCGDLCSPVATTTHPFNPDRTYRQASEDTTR